MKEIGHMILIIVAVILLVVIVGGAWMFFLEYILPPILFVLPIYMIYRLVTDNKNDKK